MVSTPCAMAALLAAADPLELAKRALSAGDPIAAFTVVSAAAVVEADQVDDARQADINLLAEAISVDALPTRALAWRAAVDGRRGAESGWEQPSLDRDRYDPVRLGRALPTLPPDEPAVAEKEAWVNVASAAVRQTASEKGKLLLRLPIGVKVKAVKRVGAFVSVSFQRPETKVKTGFIHQDLLAAKPPAIDGLLEKAKQGGKVGLVLRWRALNLDPTRGDLLDAVLDASFALARFDVAVDAVRVAITAQRWPLVGEWANATAGALRLTLYRAAVARLSSPIVSRLPGLVAWEQRAQEGGCTGQGPPRLPAAGADFWPALQGLRLSPLERSDAQWVFEADGRWLLLAYTYSGWDIAAIEAPGVVAPNENRCESRAAKLEPFKSKRRVVAPAAPVARTLLVSMYAETGIKVQLDLPETDDAAAAPALEQTLGAMPRLGVLAECLSQKPRGTRGVVELKVSGTGEVSVGVTPADACSVRALTGIRLPVTGRAYSVRVPVSVL